MGTIQELVGGLAGRFRILSFSIPMKITKITAWQVDLPLHEGNYKWSGGKSVGVFRQRCGSRRMPGLGYGRSASYAKGGRACRAGPALIETGQLGKLNQVMDQAMKGHPYVKAPVDVACWDVLGKVANLPASDLLGGTYGDDFVLYRAISQQSPEEMARNVQGYREEGYRRFQLKVGGDPDVDIERIRQVVAVLQPGDKLVADANTGWLKHEAMRVVRAVRDVDVYIEQPCLRYEDCLSVRHTDHPRDGRVDRRHTRDGWRAAWPVRVNIKISVRWPHQGPTVLTFHWDRHARGYPGGDA